MDEGFWPVKYWSGQFWPEYWPEIGEAIYLGDVECVSSRAKSVRLLGLAVDVRSGRSRTTVYAGAQIEYLQAESMAGFAGDHVDLLAGESLPAQRSGAHLEPRESDSLQTDRSGEPIADLGVKSVTTKIKGKPSCQ